MNPTFFPTPADFRAWLEAHYQDARELWVGFYKVGSGRPSITWPEAVDEALCFGWIDGLRRSVDEQSYAIRFTPRKPRTTWSAVNIARVAELTAQGRMRPAGIRAFKERVEEKSGIYAYEQRENAALDEAAERQFRANQQAWDFFQAQPPSYRKAAIWWLVRAKKEKRSTTLSPSAIRSSVVTSTSGKAARMAACAILPPSRPPGSPGSRLWLIRSGATISSSAAMSFRLCASR
ncbi:MAG TPA: YdeI/OmpD-associated family protein [Roseiflexaceae bacterium]|nr:YdeI/OmpD-associated family protein [Roseiflexaceae bacterium]